MHTYIYYISLHFITLHCIALHCIALHCIALHYITYVTLRHSTLHYIALNYITLHYLTLHYITYIYMSVYMYIYIIERDIYIHMPESSPHSLVPPLSKRHKISAPQADFSPLARFLPLAFLGMDMNRNLPFKH